MSRNTSADRRRALRRSATIGMATLAVTGILVGSGAGLASAATPTATSHPAATVMAAPAGAADAEGSTGINMVITNTTDQILTLADSVNSFGHWQQRPTDLAAHATEIVSDDGDDTSGSAITLAYRSSDGSYVQFVAGDPLLGDDTASATTSNAVDHVTVRTGSGYHPTDQYTYATTTPAAAPEQSTGSTGVTMTIINSTDQTLALNGATLSDHDISGHWQKRPTDLAPYSSETVSGYSDGINGTSMWICFDTPTGLITLQSTAPLAGSDTATSTVEDATHYRITHSTPTGYHPTTAFVYQGTSA